MVLNYLNELFKMIISNLSQVEYDTEFEPKNTRLQCHIDSQKKKKAIYEL